MQTSSAFPSAHVFPGGNLSDKQDGKVPDAQQPEAHEDSEVYRIGATRECFEESGILPAKSHNRDQLLHVEEAAREDGRKLVHESKVLFLDWVKERGGYLDTGLYPVLVSRALRIIDDLRRKSNPFHSLGHTTEHSKTLYHANVSLLPPYTQDLKHDRHFYPFRKRSPHSQTYARWRPRTHSRPLPPRLTMAFPSPIRRNHPLSSTILPPPSPFPFLPSNKFHNHRPFNSPDPAHKIPRLRTLRGSAVDAEMHFADGDSQEE